MSSILTTRFSHNFPAALRGLSSMFLQALVWKWLASSLSTLLYNSSKHPRDESLPSSRTMVPSGRVRKLKSTSTKSLPDSANTTFFFSLSTRNLTRILPVPAGPAPGLRPWILATECSLREPETLWESC